ncbi:hypothetical protein KM043_018156 [Ampulex compressa]|nr:hypothetical protein KM043_018156 [Ampulex compressa]
MKRIIGQTWRSGKKPAETSEQIRHPVEAKVPSSPYLRSDAVARFLARSFEGTRGKRRSSCQSRPTLLSVFARNWSTDTGRRVTTEEGSGPFIAISWAIG